MHEVVFFSDIIEACNHDVFPKRNFPEDVKLITYFKGSDRIPTFKVLNYKKDVIIWFRGTQVSANDVVMDVAFVEEEFLGGQCHGGYLHASRDALVLLEPYLQSADHIYTCGHSLGGACAAVVASILRLERNRPNVHCFTLACPGIFSPDVAEKTRDFVTTFCRRHDPIPRIFNVKRPVYEMYKKFSRDELIPADNVPGRQIILDKDKNGKVQARKPVDSDFELDKNFIRYLPEHSQRAYLKDILEIYGDKKVKKVNIIRQRPLHTYAIKKNFGAAVGFTAAAVVWTTAAIVGPIAFGTAGVFAGAAVIWYKIARRKAKISCGTKEDFEDEFEEDDIVAIEERSDETNSKDSKQLKIVVVDSFEVKEATISTEELNIQIEEPSESTSESSTKTTKKRRSKKTSHVKKTKTVKRSKKHSKSKKSSKAEETSEAKVESLPKKQKRSRKSSGSKKASKKIHMDVQSSLVAA